MTKSPPPVASNVLLARRVEEAYALQPLALVLTIAAAGVTAYMLGSTAPASHWGAWFALHGVTTALRWGGGLRYRASPDRDAQPQFWLWVFSVGTLASGLVWSAIGSVLFPPHGDERHIVSGFVVAGICSVGLVTTATLVVAYRAFLVAVLAPIAWYQFGLGHEVGTNIGITVVLWAGVMLAVSARAERKALASLEARMQAEGLAAELSRANADVVERNARLEQAIRDGEAAREREETLGARLSLALEAAGVSTWEYHPATGLLLITGGHGGPLIDLSPGTQLDLQAHVHPDDFASLQRAAFATTRDNGFRAEFRLRVGDAWRWVSALGQLDGRNADGGPRVVGAAIDVTRRKRTQQELTTAKDAAEAASVAKSQFLANMSHEIRTPLNGVVGMLDLIAASDLTPPQQRMAAAATRSCEALLAVINNVLDLSKIEANKLELESVPIDLTRQVEDVAALLDDAARRKGVRLTCTLDEDLPRVLGDPTRLRQVLINLVSNAVKFTERGTVRLAVTLEPAPAPDRAGIRVSVKDTGIGMTPEALDRLFQPFAQGDMSTSRHYGGTGLGLAISRQLVEAMGGEIAVASTPGTGSEFTFLLQLPVTTAEASQATGRHSMRARYRVLVTDPETVGSATLRGHCEALGHEAHVATSSERALEAFQDARRAEVPFDVAVIATRGDGREALALTRALRERCPLCLTRIIVVADPDGNALESSVRAAGADEFLVAPVSQADLGEVLTRVLQARPADTVEPVDGAAPPNTSASGPRVLVVEDNAINQQVVTAMLEQQGCQVALAASGAEGVRRASREEFDVILMDCQMPGMDGLEATRRIRAAEGMSHHVPIIALTANALQGDRERCLDAGMDDYLPKPFTAAGLRNTIQRWLAALAPASVPPTPAPAPTEAAAPVLEPRALTEVRLLDPSGHLLQQVVEIFRTDGDRLCREVKDAQRAGDANALVFAAHTLKSCSGTVGAERVRQMCHAIETNAREGILARETCVARLEADFADASAELTRLVDAAGAPGAAR